MTLTYHSRAKTLNVIGYFYVNRPTLLDQRKGPLVGSLQQKVLKANIHSKGYILPECPPKLQTFSIQRIPELKYVCMQSVNFTVFP